MKYGGPLIIVDFGTATFCAITSKAEYLGGAICPNTDFQSFVGAYSQVTKIDIVKIGTL